MSHPVNLFKSHEIGAIISIDEETKLQRGSVIKIIQTVNGGARFTVCVHTAVGLVPSLSQLLERAASWLHRCLRPDLEDSLSKLQNLLILTS